MSEWTADVLRGDKLKVPEEHQRRMRHRIIVKPPTGPAFEAWCAHVYFHPITNVLELQDALVDTSDRFEGTTIKARVTHHATVQLWGLGAIVLPYRYQEGGADGA